MSENEFNCVDEEGCDGACRREDQILVPCGCSSHMPACPCKKCGRLHRIDGTALENKGGMRAFFIGGKLENKEPVEKKA